MKTPPTFEIENEIAGKFKLIAGVDEAGRGPLCGPVVAAAVIFSSFDIDIPVVIADSKQMTRKKRALAFDWITKNTVWAAGQCSPAEIDGMNILRASMLAMKRALAGLSRTPEFSLVDGNRLPDGLAGRAVVRGDARSLSIAAASIVAKETRDRIMTELAGKFPQYGWERNAGYPTASHLQAIEKHGINRHYRKSFGPVARILAKESGINKG
ncbi:MAG: ribonuclease HII [Rickettsiales bacterium]|jgi:ribonuclease HII|nr:ribonuclease HII [Rickettsiales bacterium]